MEEINHQPHVRLLQWGEGRPQILFHAGTGEMHVMERPCQLFFADDMVAYVFREGGGEGAEDSSTEWVNQIFRYSLHAQTIDGVRKILRFDSEFNEYKQLARMAHDVSAKACRFMFRAAEVSIEIYHLEVPQGCGCLPGASSFFVCAPWPLYFMLGKQHPPNNKWTCRFVGARLVSWMGSFGFPAPSSYTRAGKKSLLERLRREGRPRPAAIEMSVEEASMVSPKQAQTGLPYTPCGISRHMAYTLYRSNTANLRNEANMRFGEVQRVVAAICAIAPHCMGLCVFHFVRLLLSQGSGTAEFDALGILTSHMLA